MSIDLIKTPNRNRTYTQNLSTRERFLSHCQNRIKYLSHETYSKLLKGVR